MARGRKTGGRQKGARNRATAEARAAAEATGILPLTYMLEIENGDLSRPVFGTCNRIVPDPLFHVEQRITCNNCAANRQRTVYSAA